MSRRDPDRIVVVTGAATGIGRATALAFGAEGAFVYLLDIDAESGSEAAGHIEHSLFISCDVTSEQDVADAFGLIGEQSQRVDVLVNNAGGFPTQRNLEDTSLEEWRQIVDLNLTSVFLITRAAVPLLRRSGRAYRQPRFLGRTGSQLPDRPSLCGGQGRCPRPDQGPGVGVGAGGDHRERIVAVGGDDRANRATPRRSRTASHRGVDPPGPVSES